MTDETYNGWSNRETWAIQLHLSNNEGDYNAMREQAEEYVSEGNTTTRDAVGAMADYIKEWTEEVFERVLGSGDEIGISTEARLFVGDVGSWWRADFYEIAAHWIDEARESLSA